MIMSNLVSLAPSQVNFYSGVSHTIEEEGWLDTYAITGGFTVGSLLGWHLDDGR